MTENIEEISSAISLETIDPSLRYWLLNWWRYALQISLVLSEICSVLLFSSASGLSLALGQH